MSEMIDRIAAIIGAEDPGGALRPEYRLRAQSIIEAIREPIDWTLGTPEGDRIHELLRPARIAACRQTDCGGRGFDEADCGNCAACADMTYFVGEAYWRAMFNAALS